MALTRSSMIPLGSALPEFRLEDAMTSLPVISTDFAQDGHTLVMLMAAHCPYVRRIAAALSALTVRHRTAGLRALGICSSDLSEFPEDGPAGLAAFAQEWNLNFPLCHDSTQGVAKLFFGTCTPDFFLFSAELGLVYRGRFDGTVMGENADGLDLDQAVAAALGGSPLADTQHPSIGCSIKWTPGNEPHYVRTIGPSKSA